MKSSLQDDAYRLAITTSWPAFFALLAAFFLGINAVFSILYMAGIDGIAGARPGSFADCFFFSVETFASDGFDEMVPRSSYARLVVSIEAFTSICCLALATGMIFTRFSRPDVRIVFAPVVAIAAIAGSATLMVKLGNRRRDALIEADARVWLIRTEIFEDEEARRFTELVLDKPDHPAVLDAWTLFHTIAAASPLSGQIEKTLRAPDTTVLVIVRGVDERTGQIVTARREYTAADVVWDKRFRATPHLPRQRRVGSCLDFDLVDAMSSRELSGDGR